MRHFRSGMASSEQEVSLSNSVQHHFRHFNNNNNSSHAISHNSYNQVTMEGENSLVAPPPSPHRLPNALEELTTRFMEDLGYPELLGDGGELLQGDLEMTLAGGSGGYFNNSTHGLDDAFAFHPTPKFNRMSLIKTVVLSLMFVISMICNSATLIQMYRMRRRRSTINTLIMHLAAADLIVTFFCNVTDAVWASTVQWYAGNSLCKLVKFLQVFGLYLSTYIIVIISVDRCYAILDPMSRNNAAKRVRILIAVAWVLSALFSLPQSYIFRVARGPFKEEFYQCVTYGAYSEVWQEKLYSTLSVLLMFVIPLVTMLTAYMLIFCTIAKKSRDLQKETETTTDMLSRGPMRGQLFRKAKVKSLQMTAVIVIAFIICWTPYYVVFIVFTFFDPKDINTHHSMWIFFFGMANSMVNPMIYGAFHCCKRRRSPDPPVQYPRPLPRTTCTTKTSSSSRSPRSLGGQQGQIKVNGYSDTCLKIPSSPFIQKRQSLAKM